MITRRLFAASSLALPFAASCQTAHPSLPPNPWRSAPPLPYAVQEIYPALHEGAIWVAGGFSPEALGATARVSVFDIAREAWRAGPDLPAPSHHVHLAAAGGALYAIGGFLGGETRTRWICTTRVLKLEGETWVEAASLPKPIGEAVPLIHEGRIHLIGGRSPSGEANSSWNDQADVTDHFVLNAGAPAWERAAPLPMARNSAAGAPCWMAHFTSSRAAPSQTAKRQRTIFTTHAAIHGALALPILIRAEAWRQLRSAAQSSPAAAKYSSPAQSAPRSIVSTVKTGRHSPHCRRRAMATALLPLATRSLHSAALNA